MLRNIMCVVLFFISYFVSAQNKPYKDGEWLHYRLSYSGFLKAGEAEIKLTKETLNGKEVFHAKGNGKTTGVVRWFFKVKDRYESYFDTENVKPYRFIRDVYEGGYTIRRDIDFKDNKAYVKDYKLDKEEFKDAVNIQDVISCFYYLRAYDTASMKVGEELPIDVFFDGESYPFKLKYLGDEIFKSKFGKVNTQIFRPMVMSGRVFKEKESVTVWVTADKNKIPIYIKAKLAVGSVRANLKKYKGLSYPLEIVKD